MPETQDRDDEYPWFRQIDVEDSEDVDLDDVDDIDDVFDDCAMGSDGLCGKAGSEECDWECPFSK